MRNITISLAVICLLLLGACSGDPLSPTGGTPDRATPREAGLPGLPDAAPPTRLAQAANHPFTDADLYAAAGAAVSGSGITLETTGLSWAVFGVELTGAEIPTVLHLTGTVTSELWLGVSDYDNGCWDWLDPCTGPADINLGPRGSLSTAGWFYVVLACPAGHGAAVELSLDSAEETWNVMVWMAGDNDLAADAVADLNEMESVGSTANVNILVGFDIDPEIAPATANIDAVHYIRVVADDDAGRIVVDGHPANQSFPREGFNSADPAELAAFLEWCDTNFEANRSLLVLWNHGSGWVPPGGDAAGAGRAQRRVSGILCDDTDGAGAMVGNDAVAGALAGRHFDYLCWDACNMGEVEALHDFQGLANYLVGSSLLEPSGGYPYDLWLGDWLAGFPRPYAEVGELLCEHYTDYWEAQSDYGSMGMYAGTQGPGLVESLAELAAVVTPRAATEGDHVKQAIKAAYKPFPSDGTADLGQFLADYRERTSDAKVRSRLDAAITAYGDFVRCFTCTNQVDGSGCHAFLPNTGELEQYGELYRGTAFNQATGWLEMLEATGVPEGEADWPTVNWQPGWRMICEWDDPAPDIQLFFEDPAGNYGHPGAAEDLAQSIIFSQDNLVSGEALEWGELSADPLTGYFLAAVNYDAEGPVGPASVTLSARLEDDLGAVVYDFGSFELARGDMDHWVAFLPYVGAVSGAWIPGDTLEISWDPAGADFSLGVTDPRGYWGSPGYTSELEGSIEFSLDSLESGETLEWGRLLSGGREGMYVCSVYYSFFDGTAPESIAVAVRLLDGSGSLKQDLGTTVFAGESEIGVSKEVAVLQY